MKTPEEIKRGLECCMKAGFQPGPCKVCPYYDEGIYDCAGVLGKDILQYIQQLEEHLSYTRRLCERFEAQVPRWIPMKEQLPPKGKSVIVMNGHGYVTMLALVHKVKNYWTWIGIERVGHYNDVTHWMPLPERRRRETDET